MDDPHIRQPFRVLNGAVPLVNGGDPVEVGQAAQTVLSYSVGFRDDLPEFGVQTQVWKMGGVDPEEFRRALREWEPRYDAEVTRRDLGLINVEERPDA